MHVRIVLYECQKYIHTRNIYACQKYMHIRKIYACQKYMHIRNIYACKNFQKYKTAKSGLQIFLVSVVWRYHLKIIS